MSKIKQVKILNQHEGETLERFTNQINDTARGLNTINIIYFPRGILHNARAVILYEIESEVK